MKLLFRAMRRLADDFGQDDLRAVLFIWLANIVPDLYACKLLKALFLKAAGVRTGIDSVYFKSRIAVDSPGKLTIGSGVFINRNVVFEGEGAVSISGNCQIGPNVVFATTSHDIGNRMSTTVGDIRVEENVWIGAAAIILKGVQIGPNVVVAAGSVVTSSFSNCVIAGVPARSVRQLEGSDQDRP